MSKSEQEHVIISDNEAVDAAGDGSHMSAAEILSRNAARYIEEHYAEKFSLDAVASALYVNKIYLSKSFKQTTGDTLLHYHNSVRCRKACELLETTDLSIEIIGNRVGYVTPSHFARVFRHCCGCSPTDYRRQFGDAAASVS